MTTVAITGVSGCLGQGLLARLETDSSVDRVLGVDVVHPPPSSTKLEFHEADIREARLSRVLAGAESLVHLAFVTEPAKDTERARSVNVDGTRRVLAAAASAGVTSVVYASSASVYGLHSDNDFPLTEASSLRPNADLEEAVDKHAAEQLLESFREDHPEIPVAILRLAIVLGPRVNSFVSRMFEAPRIPVIKGHAPPLQALHEEDAAAALHFAVASRLDGVFNVAASGWMEQEEVLALVAKRSVELPEAVAFSLAERAWRLGLSAGPPSELRFLMHPLVLDGSRLEARGWKPERTNREALVETVEAHRMWVSLGRSRIRKAHLAKGAAATLGVIGALAATRRARRRS